MAPVVSGDDEQGRRYGHPDHRKEWVGGRDAVRVHLRAVVHERPVGRVAGDEALDRFGLAERRGRHELGPCRGFQRRRRFEALDEPAPHPARVEADEGPAPLGPCPLDGRRESVEVDTVHPGQVIEALGDAPASARLRLPVDLVLGQIVHERVRIAFARGDLVEQASEGGRSRAIGHRSFLLQRAS